MTYGVKNLSPQQYGSALPLVAASLTVPTGGMLNRQMCYVNETAELEVQTPVLAIP